MAEQRHTEAEVEVVGIGEGRGFRTGGATPTNTVFVETGRGDAVEVPVGSNFIETMERISEQAHYGGSFRVFLNGGEIVDDVDSPPTIQSGMRIAITAYDKVGEL